ncbi:hypothetical protein [Nocardia sp. NBC_01388]|uniref:hypothetical protein n=1 Tax=Nocardia sp. NBC_01388 TaxID=2903596 RepID=UPI002F90ED44
MAREREIAVVVPLVVPPVGALLIALVAVVVGAVLVAVVVCTAHFSDGSSVVPSTPGPCAPFCSAPLGGGQR